MCQIRYRECRSDQIVARTRSPTYKLLLLILDCPFQIRLLLRSLEYRHAKSAAIDLLQLQILRKVVIERRLDQGEEARRQVLIPLAVDMVDGGLGHRFRYRHSCRDVCRLSDLSIGSCEVG